jgi:adenylate kinase family enzyme
MNKVCLLPHVIILYGPPLAGKGTQAAFLEKLLPDYIHLDFGTSLRDFVAKNIESTDSDIQKRAFSIQTLMAKGSPVETPDLRFVVEKTITDAVKSGQKLLIEGPGRKIEEAIWLSEFFKSLNIDIAIFHLHIDLEVTIERSKWRWYGPNNTYPYIGFEAAKTQCKVGEEPYQRVEDKDPAINTKRYDEIYDDVYARIIQTYQLTGGAYVYTLDASDTIENVSKAIVGYLTNFYGFTLK